jgi:hypothetical protein
MATQARPKPSEPTESQKFTELARRLISVPKQEADKQREAYEKERGREKPSEKRAGK